MLRDNTCYKDSPGKVEDLVASFQVSQQKCMNEGGRLLQIRSIEALNHLFEWRGEGHFSSNGYMENRPKAVVAIGLKYTQLNGDSEKKFYY
jgi:hypothetical protein